MNKVKLTSFFILALLFANSVLGKAQIEATNCSFGNNRALGKYIDHRGFKMYYETYGSGEPLLMIHGNGGSISNFENQIPYFSKKYKVIVADSRAQGKSVDASDSLSYEMMADDLNGLLDTLKIDSCYVIGWSDGGIEALLLAMRHPHKVKKLASTGANLWPDSSVVGGVMYDEALKYYNSLQKEVQTDKVKNDTKLARIIAFKPHISANQLSTISCPALIIGGDHDIILPQHTLFIFQSIPNSFLCIVPNSGHGTLIEHKDLFNKVVDDFFKR